MMHRDINPNNLTVRSLKHIQGIIIDLDAVTTSPSSSDHRRGTLPYLAPEIIALKDWEEKKLGERPSGYGKGVDVWALGLSMYAVNTGSRVYWPSFPSSKEKDVNMVNYERYKVLSQRLDTRISLAAKRGALDLGILETIKASLRYRPGDRPSATVNLEAILILTLSHSVGDGMIRPKQGTKRAHGG